MCLRLQRDGEVELTAIARRSRRPESWLAVKTLTSRRLGQERTPDETPSCRARNCLRQGGRQTRLRESASSRRGHRRDSTSDVSNQRRGAHPAGRAFKLVGNEGRE